MEYRYAVEVHNTDAGWFQRFVYGGAEPYDVEPGLSDNATYRQVRVVSSRPVNPRLERWNGSQNPDACTRAATADEIAAWDAQHQAPRRLSKFTFLRLLTPTEYGGMFNVTDPMLAYGVACFQAAPDPFNIDDPLVAQMLDYCVSSGVMTASRRADLWAEMEAAAA